MLSRREFAASLARQIGTPARRRHERTNFFHGASIARTLPRRAILLLIFIVPARRLRAALCTAMLAASCAAAELDHAACHTFMCAREVRVRAPGHPRTRTPARPHVLVCLCVCFILNLCTLPDEMVHHTQAALSSGRRRRLRRRQTGRRRVRTKPSGTQELDSDAWAAYRMRSLAPARRVKCVRATTERRAPR